MDSGMQGSDYVRVSWDDGTWVGAADARGEGTAGAP